MASILIQVHDVLIDDDKRVYRMSPLLLSKIGQLLFNLAEKLAS
jgi:hypothetical protein